MEFPNLTRKGLNTYKTEKDYKISVTRNRFIDKTTIQKYLILKGDKERAFFLTT